MRNKEMEKLEISDNFSFPFEPYDIQVDFMKKLFHVLENRNLGIFESPTGTGKSLSLICGALTWLSKHTEHHKLQLEKTLKENEESMQKSSESFDWFSNAAKRQDERQDNYKITQELALIKKQEARVASLKQRRKVIKHNSVMKVDNEFDELFRDLEDVREQVKMELNEVKTDNDLPGDEAELILDDYISDDEDVLKKENDEDDIEDNGCLKIYFCSRTHSQLAQFVRELQKTAFAEDARVVSLASRQNLCINDAVVKLSNTSLINDRCIDLQRGKKGQTTKKSGDGIAIKRKKSSVGCPYYKQNTIKNLSDQMLLEVQDIEQLVSLGKRLKSCPYYGSRYAIRDAQVIVLPYNTLLHKATRDTCKINLKDNIVIVDEAHNLLETISNIHSVLLFQSQLTGCHSQISQYLERYEKRLSPQNLLYIKQILFFINSIIKLLNPVNKNKMTANTTQPDSKLMTVFEFLSTTMTDNLNIFKLIQYIERSKISHKLHGFSQKFEGQVKLKPKFEEPKMSTSAFISKMSNQKHKENVNPTNIDPTENEESKKQEFVVGSPLMVVTEFLKALLSGCVDGRIIVTVDQIHQKSSIKYLLLNPSSQFHDIVNQCRSVIVAGGTMRPMSEFKDQLFISANADPARIVEFSCGHVVPGEQLLPLVLPSGPSNTLLDFTYQRRNDKKVMDELGRIIINVCNIVPGGIVCFLPSYEYEKKVFDHFLNSGQLTKISNKKKVFREPKKSSELDNVLNDFSKTIKLSVNNTTGLTGSIVFSVVGGKLSEGINFSDNLGRCVIMVGLPYPNSHAPELREKMNYLNRTVPNGPDGRTAGAIYYENLCFKAVNQSIGRAIRHRGDYASIVLADHRYNRAGSVKALPEWISKHLHQCQKFGEAFGLLRKFFADKRKK